METFETLVDIISRIRVYAKEAGFSIHPQKQANNPLVREVLCTRNRKQAANPESDSDSDIQIQQECPFQVSVQKTEEAWRVTFVNSFHNHTLKPKLQSSAVFEQREWPLQPVEDSVISPELQHKI